VTVPLYTVFNLSDSHMQMPSGGYLHPKGAAEGRDRAYPVDVPPGHILWKLAVPQNGRAAQVRIVEGDVPSSEPAPTPVSEPQMVSPVEASPPPAPIRAFPEPEDEEPEPEPEPELEEPPAEDEELAPLPEDDEPPPEDEEAVLAGLSQAITAETGAPETQGGGHRRHKRGRRR
jgi:hypothetical protein